MSEAYKNIEQGRFSLRDAEVITETKLLEQTPTLNWESSDANRATRQAALAVGEDASAASFLVARARVVEKMIVAKNPTVKPTSSLLKVPESTFFRCPFSVCCSGTFSSMSCS